MSDKQYGHDDARDYEPYFSLHLMAMTAEDLHSKGEIACELAYRDARIAELEAENQRLRNALRIYADPDTWGNDGWGVKAVNTWEYKDAGAAARQALLGGGE